MRLLNAEELQRLLGPQPEPCISIFLPTHKTQPAAAEDPIRYKNSVKSAEKLLAQKYSERDIRGLLGPVEALSEPSFWRHQAAGLAVYRSPELLAAYRLPIRVPELTVVADSFHVKPLLGFIQSNQRYYVLLLSTKATAFYEGSATGLKAIDLARLPGSLAAALGVVRHERMVNLHSGGRGQAAVYHGQGAPEVIKKTELAQFFRAVDQALWELLRSESSPLVLAGAAYYFPIYREISRYKHVAEKGVEGSFDPENPEELHQRAWPVAAELFGKLEDDALVAYKSLENRRLGVDILTDIAKAAVQGRVRRLFLGEGKRLFGRLDPESGQVTLNGAQTGPTDDDVLDDLAQAVLARGGDVLLLPQQKMPGDAAAAAILRW